MSEPILYTTDDGKSRIQLRAHEQTVWLTQLEMAELSKRANLGKGLRYLRHLVAQSTRAALEQRRQLVRS